MLTFNAVLNTCILACAVAWLVLLPRTIRRIVGKRGKRTPLDVACYSIMAALWLLSVLLPFRRHGTLNTGNEGVFFWTGIVATYIPGLVAWWQRRSTRAA